MATAKSWRDNLKPASFRGIKFEVESGDMAVGRRVQTHEYPGRDDPYTEDLGRSARKITIEAFLVGDDFMVQRDKLLSALEQGGPGELVHPWHGSMQLNVDGECHVRHGIREGRYCAISISLVESGELAAPAATDATGPQALIAADVAKLAAENEFAKFFQVGGLPSFVLDDALKGLNTYMSALEAGMANLTVISKIALNVLKGDFSDLLPTAYSLANRITGLFNQADALANAFNTNADSSTISVAGVPEGTGPYSVARIAADAKNLATTLAVIDAVSQFPATSSAVATPASQQAESNSNAIATLISSALLVQASGMAASINLPVHEDSLLLRNKLLRAIDAHCSRVKTDEAFEAFRDLRSKLNRDLTAKMRNAERLRSFTPHEVLPALVLAYELYDTPTRDAEIVARNKIRHPGFVPVEAIKVLTA